MPNNVNWSGDVESFGDIIRATGKPVVLADDSRISDEELLTHMTQIHSVGAIGCSVGRNIRQYENSQAMTKAVSCICRENWSAEMACEELVETLYPQHGKNSTAEDPGPPPIH